MRGAPTLEAVAPRWEESTICDAGGGLITIALVWPENPVLLNTYHGMHYRKEAQERQRWRGAFRQMAASCPRLAWADLTIWHEVGRRLIPDNGATAITVKWALDGCRDWDDDDPRSPTYGQSGRGIVADDDGRYIRRHIYEPPYYSGRYALTLEFTGQPE